MKTSKPLFSRKPLGKQGGVAAVELALVFPILLAFLMCLMFISSCFWHYTVAQKAAQDAARYLSTVSAQEMRSPALARAAVAVATAIATREMAQLSPGSTIAPPEIRCGAQSCGMRAGIVPSTISVFITFSMFDTFFGTFNTGRYGLPITADVTMNYVGN